MVTPPSNDPPNQKLGSIFKHSTKSMFSVAFLFLIGAFFSSQNESFLTTENITGILLSASILLIVSCGAAFVILMGSIDLSVGATVSIAGMLSASLIPQLGFWALIVGPLCGLAIGLLNGGLFVTMRIPSIVTTLGVGTMLSGLVFFISDGRSIPVSEPEIVAFTMHTPFPAIPLLTVYALLIFLACILIQGKTKIGRTIFAIGGDEKVVSLLGAKIAQAKLFSFAVSGFLAGLTGSLLTSRLGTAASQMGSFLTLDSITAVVLSGISILGGAGYIRSVVLGVLIIAILNNGMSILSVHPYLQTIVKGSVIVLAVLLTSIRPSAEDIK
ncbi:putative Ribose ABC transport system, permease protein RbsC [Vibrio nigripulchritudo SFn27]|uniref:ABC transporter permease n=1 Tax=Vibrio nigripulchritudo TaxID=28173 RepID=UPI0003B1CF3B|nr:ABC transporter permease [Vibrio nigripulchritudo]CCN82440.1 putative Ribose ABC transport system, permease protein RbsC [Vibrio nigripulchritudo BLFn1]CCN91426.1 putative Ribose ABC transport system, permease protein RbsC [Vibrio nigripulchritudo SFn27]CCN97591.1 putative Ribose ABC transport system, permease protein RbsC [Vibrio nigripulchritudo ENn2]CCO38733.1 putative Ribose ABC transport system, permease protein RbsC [Vibrio nigripulchritudo SFn135]CCO55138.1 putative Ribose ABC transp